MMRKKEKPDCCLGMHCLRMCAPTAGGPPPSSPLLWPPGPPLPPSSLSGLPECRPWPANDPPDTIE
eukprot:8389446-Heterocapsa_arctica.AAC.1